MIIRHGIIAVTEHEEEGKLKVLHFVGYENEPSEEEIDRLEDELRTSEELGLVGEEFTLIRATPELVDEIMEKWGSDPNNVIEHSKRTLN